MNKGNDDMEDIDIVIERPSRAKRWMRSLFARMRRHKVKEIKKMHELKAQKELKKKLK